MARPSFRPSKDPRLHSHRSTQLIAPPKSAIVAVPLEAGDPPPAISCLGASPRPAVGSCGLRRHANGSTLFPALQRSPPPPTVTQRHGAETSCSIVLYKVGRAHENAVWRGPDRTEIQLNRYGYRWLQPLIVAVVGVRTLSSTMPPSSANRYPITIRSKNPESLTWGR